MNLLGHNQLYVGKFVENKKNKVSARNSRKRKTEQFKQLEDDVQKIRCQKTELIQEHDRLLLELRKPCSRPQTAQMVGNVESYDMDSSSVISGMEQKEHIY